MDKLSFNSFVPHELTGENKQKRKHPVWLCSYNEENNLEKKCDL